MYVSPSSSSMRTSSRSISDVSRRSAINSYVNGRGGRDPVMPSLIASASARPIHMPITRRPSPSSRTTTGGPFSLSRTAATVTLIMVHLSCSREVIQAVQRLLDHPSVPSSAAAPTDQWLCSLSSASVPKTYSIMSWCCGSANVWDRCSAMASIPLPRGLASAMSSGMSLPAFSMTSSAT